MRHILFGSLFCSMLSHLGPKTADNWPKYNFCSWIEGQSMTGLPAPGIWSDPNLEAMSRHSICWYFGWAHNQKSPIVLQSPRSSKTDRPKNPNQVTWSDPNLEGKSRHNQLIFSTGSTFMYQLDCNAFWTKPTQHLFSKLTNPNQTNWIDTFLSQTYWPNQCNDMKNKQIRPAAG